MVPLLQNMFIWNILMLNVIVHARKIDIIWDELHDIDADSCNSAVLDVWIERYEKGYHGHDPPQRRCEKEGGYCLREHDRKCPSGDKVHYQTKCYNRCECCFRKVRQEGTTHWRLIKRRVTWKAASDMCRYEDGELLVPENIATVIEFIRENKLEETDVWIGVTDNHSGQYEGIHGNKIVSGWQNKQPRNEDDEGHNCVVVEDDEFDGPGMKVEPCRAWNYFICDDDEEEHRLIQHPVVYDEKLLKGNEEKRGMGSDRERYYGTRVKIIGQRKNWMDARRDCRRQGGDLLVPESVSTFIDFMRKEGVGSRDVWIGYSDKYYEKEFEGIHGNTIKGGWMPGEPRWVVPGEDCVVIEDDIRQGAGLKVDHCYDDHIYACDFTKHFDSEHDTWV